MLRAGVYAPCAVCNATELDALRHQQDSSKAKWLYTVEVDCVCSRCDKHPLVKAFLKYSPHLMATSAAISMISELRESRAWWAFCATNFAATIFLRQQFLRTRKQIDVPLNVDDVSLVERLCGAATVSEKGSKLRPYGSYISMLTSYESSSLVKTALLVWGPTVIWNFMDGSRGSKRIYIPGQLSDSSDPAECSDAVEGNADLNGSGSMPGTSLDEDAYAKDVTKKGHRECITGEPIEPCEPRELAKQVGPSIREAECFESTHGNVSAALDNRNQAPPFKADRAMKRRIGACVDKLISVVFSEEKIKAWRIGKVDKDGNYVLNLFEDMHSKKWTSDRFAHAVDECYADVHREIENGFMNKTNEVQDAGDKLPRPRNLIECGDEGQVKMIMPVKCFEDLLFEHFKYASIKKCTKHDAMRRVATRLNQRRPVSTVEGDGSSWDACCNAEIRNMTENRIMAKIVEILGFDAECPNLWMEQCIQNLNMKKIRGKAKIVDFVVRNIKVKIDAIRQSGHRGTSAFNWLINFVCWTCVLAENPEDLIDKVLVKGRQTKTKEWLLPDKYISNYDGVEYSLRYVFEGDDSALTTTEELASEGRQKNVLDSWTSLGFKMKLVFCTNKLTFTGFDFLNTPHGPSSTFFPEVKRNIASSSWTTSPEVRQRPDQLHRVAAAGFLARAENFVDCQPLCHYFAALGLAHCGRLNGDEQLGEQEALQLGIEANGAIVDRLHAIVDNSKPLSAQALQLLEITCGKMESERLFGLVNVHIDDPLDAARAKHILPKQLWESKGMKARPRGEVARLLQMCSSA